MIPLAYLAGAVAHQRLLNSGQSFNVDALALINRMTAAGETPTAARQTAINNCIVSLKANNLFSSQFDVLVVTRGHGSISGFMNWIADQYNAVGVANGGTLTHVIDSGYKTDGVASYINVNVSLPSFSLYKQNDACFIYLCAGTIGAQATSGHGMSNVSTGRIYMLRLDGYQMMNGSSYGTGGSAYIAGYNCFSRVAADKFQQYKNSISADVTEDSSALQANMPMYILAFNNSGTPQWFVNNTEVAQIYAFGKQLSLVNFQTFQTIMNTYFATF